MGLIISRLACPSALQTFAEAGVGDDVGSSIQHEEVITPPDWQQRYGLRHGAAFGLGHDLDQLSLFRYARMMSMLGLLVVVPSYDSCIRRIAFRLLCAGRPTLIRAFVASISWVPQPGLAMGCLSA